jgi:phage terminase small subunit
MRKKTYEEHVDAGTLRLDKMREAELHTVKEMPKPAKYLTKTGVKIYKEICVHLVLHDSLCEIDSHYVSGVARSLDVFIRMVNLIEEKETKKQGSGYFQVFQTGARQFSPEYMLMSKEWDKFETGCKALGLNLKSRDTIAAFAKSNDDGPEGGDELNLN